jgi:hypothetical protein
VAFHYPFQGMPSDRVNQDSGLATATGRENTLLESGHANIECLSFNAGRSFTKNGETLHAIAGYYEVF